MEPILPSLWHLEFPITETIAIYLVTLGSATEILGLWDLLTHVPTLRFAYCML